MAVSKAFGSEVVSGKIARWFSLGKILIISILKAVVYTKS